MTEPVVALFARAPIVGKAKTRLIASLGEQGAVTAHIELVQRALGHVDEVAGVRKTLWSTELDGGSRAWADKFGFELYQQSGIGLGARMAHAIESLLAQGGAGVCLLGSDCPTLDADYIRQALLSLKQFDLVLGPAEDGGYGLIACNHLYAGLFEDIPWSTSQVLPCTLAKAKELALRVHLLDEIWDVDEAEDWLRYRKFSLRSDP